MRISWGTHGWPDVVRRNVPANCPSTAIMTATPAEERSAFAGEFPHALVLNAHLRIPGIEARPSKRNAAEKSLPADFDVARKAISLGRKRRVELKSKRRLARSGLETKARPTRAEELASSSIAHILVLVLSLSERCSSRPRTRNRTQSVSVSGTMPTSSSRPPYQPCRRKSRTRTSPG